MKFKGITLLLIRFFWIGWLFQSVGIQTTYAQANSCQLQLQCISGTQRDVTAALGGNTDVPLLFNIINNSTTPCTYTLTFDAGSSGNFTFRHLTNPTDSQYFVRYNLWNNDQVLQSQPASLTLQNTINGTINGETSQQLMVSFRCEKEAPFVPYCDSPYTDTIHVKLYNELPPVISSSPVADVALLFTANIVKELRMSLVKEGMSTQNFTEHNAEIDFGELVTGANRRLSLMIKSNNGYKISFSSENHGHLKLTGAAPPHAAFENLSIPYTFTVNDVPVAFEKSLNTPYPLPDLSKDPGTLTNKDADRLPLSFTIGKVDDVLAGEYQDVITVIVEGY